VRHVIVKNVSKNYDDIFGIWDVSVWESQEKIGRTMFEQ